MSLDLDLDLDEPIVVTTHRSTYRLGQSDENDERSIFCNNKKLEFTRCKIYHLAGPNPMVVIIMDGSKQGQYFRTSRVFSVKQDLPN